MDARQSPVYAHICNVAPDLPEEVKIIIAEYAGGEMQSVAHWLAVYAQKENWETRQRVIQEIGWAPEDINGGCPVCVRQETFRMLRAGY